MKEQMLNWLAGTLILVALVSALFVVAYLGMLWPPLVFVLMTMAMGGAVGSVFGKGFRRWLGMWKIEADVIMRKLWRR